MHKNDLLKGEDRIIRVLAIEKGRVLIIDCIKKTVPKWRESTSLNGYEPCSSEELYRMTKVIPVEMEQLDGECRKKAYERYALVAAILPFMEVEKERCEAIARVVKQSKLSRQTIIKALCLYLVYQSIAVLAPKWNTKEKPLSVDEKNMRWALNKFFYSRNQNSLKIAYTSMLKERYCDGKGELQEEYPSIHQFRYFYRKHKSMRKYYISRNGMTDYQRNKRPLLGDGVSEFAPRIGVGMLDSTVCDIYLVNREGQLIGRPILTACVDAYSGLCCGYSLTWEGGVYSLRNLMLNVISDKVELCKKHGIDIEQDAWNCCRLPSTLVTDMGKEYVSGVFDQIADLGVIVINLPPYRPELKGVVEKFFDVIQNLYKPYLKGKGVIDVDFRERGAHDYRKDAVLTLEDFEKILLHCLIYYNSKRILENFPYTEHMLAEGIRPTASDIWNYWLAEDGACLISVSEDTLTKTLLPRTMGVFRRNGLVVNKLRYKNRGYTEEYLKGGTVTVAYNPEDVSKVWLIEKGDYIEFSLIESRFDGMNIDEVGNLRNKQHLMIRETERENMQARIDLERHIGIIARTCGNGGDTNIKGIRENRQREQRKMHVDYFTGGNLYG